MATSMRLFIPSELIAWLIGLQVCSRLFNPDSHAPLRRLTWEQADILHAQGYAVAAVTCPLVLSPQSLKLRMGLLPLQGTFKSSHACFYELILSSLMQGSHSRWLP